MEVLDRLKAMTDDELLGALINCNEGVLPIVQMVWNKRHPEDKIQVSDLRYERQWADTK